MEPKIDVQQADLFEDQGIKKIDWVPRRQAGLDRLRQFVPVAGPQYARTRNFDFGAEHRSNISCLSPWIRHRAVLEQEVLVQALARFKPSSAEKFIQEVFWRGYFKGWLENRPSAWTHFCRDLESLQQNIAADKDLLNRYQAAISGETGIDCFDHWSDELVSTNYLHNHARMWFASIWIFTLKLPWQLGAGFFLRHLLDGDPAANTLSWRWVGGLHTKGKTYTARAENINRFTNGRFNPHGQLSKLAPALLEHVEHLLSPLPLQQPWPDTLGFGLLVTEEDLHSESLDLLAPPSAIAVLPAAPQCGPVTLSDSVLAFRQGLLNDAALRAQGHFDCDTAHLTCRSAQTLIGWAQNEDVDTIVLSRPPVGPTKDWLEATIPELSAAGIKCHLVGREFDAHIWRHATAGFFKLKKRIPSLLDNVVTSDVFQQSRVDV